MDVKRQVALRDVGMFPVPGSLQTAKSLEKRLLSFDKHFRSGTTFVTEIFHRHKRGTASELRNVWQLVQELNTL